MISDGGFAAAQDIGDLAGVSVLHLAQDERRLLLAAQLRARLLEEAREPSFFGGPARLGGSRLLLGADQMKRGAMSFLAALGASQKIDREIRGDSIEPGIEGVLLVVAIELLPNAQEDQLSDVAGVLAITHDAARHRENRRGLPNDQRLEGDSISAPSFSGELEIGQLDRLPTP